MRRIAVLGFLALLGAGLPIGASAANTITVCAGGCDHTTIAAAIAAASPGDTIDIGSGTYTENGLTIDKSLTLRGVAPAPAVSDPEQLLTAGVLETIVQTAGPGNGPTFTIVSPAAGTSPEVAFEDLAIVGNDDFDTIRVSSNDPVLVQSLELTGVGLTGSRAAINTVGLRPIHGLRVADSAVTCTGASNPTGGILLGMADGVGDAVHVKDSYLAECGWPINAGNHAGFGTSAAVAGVVEISGNTMVDNRFGCVLIALSYSDLRIADNTMTNCDLTPSSFDGAINLQALTPATDVTVSGNEITRTPGSGGNVGVIIQNIPASAGNLARFVVEDNDIHGLIQSSTSDAVRLGPTAINRAAADIDIDIVHNNLFGNSRGMSWQTNAGDTIGANLDVHFNRIAGSAVGTRRAISLFGFTPRIMDAENNWFGCNEGPSVGAPLTDCDSVGLGSAAVSVDFDPWLVLTANASPSEILPNGDTSDITAEVTSNSDGDAVATSIPDGPTVTFATDLGSVAPTMDVLSAGMAQTVLTSGAAYGVASVDATLDAETVTTPVTILAPNASKQEVLATLQDLLPTGDAKLDKRIEKAIQRLQKSLTAEWWIDTESLDPKKGNKVFDAEKKVIHELSKKELAGNTVAEDLIDVIVAVDRSLAQYALDNPSVGASAKDIAKANEEMAKGDADAAAGKYENAIEHYKQAWMKVAR